MYGRTVLYGSLRSCGQSTGDAGGRRRWPSEAGTVHEALPNYLRVVTCVPHTWA